ncbi:MAG: hypothetical protein M3P94_04100 [Chloroflexota bacterium]|nr:hypothetical protein [Chloroflexota bacterium]
MTDTTPTPTIETTPPPDPRPPAPTFTPEQEAELNRRMVAARREGEADGKKKVESSVTAKAEDERKERERKEAEARGEFDKVKSDLTSERDTAKAEATSLKAENDQLRAFFDGQVAAALRTLPDALKDFDPGPDAPFAARASWLEKAQKRAAELGESTGGNRGNGWDPKPSGRGELSIEDEKRAIRRGGAYRM